MRFLALLALVAEVPFSYGFWRMECRGVTGYYRIDPLVSPGEASSHLHAILGSGGLSETSTYDDLIASDCTSCLVTEDKSAYWHPAMYFLDTTTNEYELVEQVGGTLAYYLLNTGSKAINITAFPKGFRMISGDNSRRSFSTGNVEMVDPPKSSWAALGQTTQEALAQRALGFNCLDYSKTPESSLYRHFMPDKDYLDANCPDGIRLELMFPSCWNGKDLDSDNHRDHVAFPDLVMDGDCPDDFPIRMPSLFYETIWNTAAYTGRTGQFVMSNGDVQGFAYHGDFMTGWDVDFLQKAIETCTSSTGLIADCPLFTIQSLAEAQSCKLDAPAALKSDSVTTGLKVLPGNLTPFGSYLGATMIATYDPALSAPQTTAGVEAVVAQAVNVAAASAIASIDTTSGSSSLPAPAPASTTATTSSTSTPAALPSTTSTTSTSTPPAATPSTSPTTPAVPTTTSTPRPTTTTTSSTVITSSVATAPPVVKGHYVSTQYLTNGKVVTEILWAETTVYVTESYDESTSTTTVVATVPAVKPRHAHNHMNRHARMRRHRQQN